MSLIQYCMQKNIDFQKTKHFYFLASNDKALKRAYKAIVRNEEVDSEKEIGNIVFESWGDKTAATAISEKYAEVYAKANSPKRKKTAGVTIEYLNILESEIDLSLKKLLK